MLCLIIYLKSHHAGPSCGMLHKAADNSFSMTAKHRIQQIHKLPLSIGRLSFPGLHHDARLFFYQPGRDCIGRSSDNHTHILLLRHIQYSVHEGKVKDSFLRLQGTPGGLRYPHHIHACCLHHL